MKEITKYVSDDGKEFDTKEECEKYEDVLASLMSFADTIRRYCSDKDDCQGCPFGYGTDCVFVNQSPEEWDLENCEGYTEKKIESPSKNSETRPYRGCKNFDRDDYNCYYCTNPAESGKSCFK